MYHAGSRELQDRFDTRRLADRLTEVTVRDHVNDADRAFIEARDMFFLATADTEGRPTCSYKGGDPGFVTVLDEHTVAWPNYDGNGMYLSLGNALVNPHVGLLFIDFEGQRGCGWRARRASTTRSALARCRRSSSCACAVTRVFPNCPRYIHRMELVERSAFVPRAGEETPVPAWKRNEWARDVLPAGDPADD